MDGKEKRFEVGPVLLPSRPRFSSAEGFLSSAEGFQQTCLRLGTATSTIAKEMILVVRKNRITSEGVGRTAKEERIACKLVEAVIGIFR